MPFVLLLAALSIALHVAGAAGYGYAGEELYFIVASDHLDWGYAEHGPLVAYLALFGRILLGTSLWAVRAGPALAGAVTVVASAVLARRLGAGRFGMYLAALATLLSPTVLAAHAQLAPAALTPVLAMGLALTLVDLVRHGEPRRWPLVGIWAALAFLNDPWAALLLPLVALSMLLSGQAGLVLSRWFGRGIVAAGFLTAPNLLWRMAENHDLPSLPLPASTVELWAQRGLDVVAAVQPAWFPLVVGGVLALALTPRLRPGRALGWAAGVIIAVSMAFGVATERLVYLWPLACAAGACWFETLTWRGPRRWLRPVLVVAILGNGLLSAPFVLPLLPVDTLASYEKQFGSWVPRPDRGAHGLPQALVDRLGWVEQVDAIERTFLLVDVEKRSQATVWVASYATAAAVDVLGERFGLPRAMCAERGFRSWGPSQPSGEWLVAAGIPPAMLRPRCQSLREVETIACPWCAEPHRRLTIFLCALRKS